MLGLTGWPAVAEEAIIARDCLLTGHVGSRLHVCHVSTAGSVELIRWAKGKGWDVTAEVTPHHLLLTDDLRLHATTRSSRSTRRCAPQADVDALRAGLADGTIDCVATDHAPHALEDKETEWGAAPARHDRPRDGAVASSSQTMVEPGRLDLARRSPSGCPRRPRASAGSTGHGRPLAVGEPANLVPRRPGRPLDGRPARPCATPQPQHARSPAASCRPGCVATFLRGRPTVLDGAQAPRDATGVLLTARHARLLAVVGCSTLLMLRGLAQPPAPPGATCRRRRSRPATPATVVVPAVAGLFVGTTFAGDWLDRVAVHGLPHRAAGRLHRRDRRRARRRARALPELFLPYGVVERAGLGDALAGKVDRRRRACCSSTWRLGDRALTSGFRADDHAEHRARSPTPSRAQPDPSVRRPREHRARACSSSRTAAPSAARPTAPSARPSARPSSTPA